MGNSYVGWSATLPSCRLGARTAYHPKAEVSDVDQYGRIFAVCSAGGEDLNAWMVRQGWALAYRHYSTAYVADEDAAHLGRRMHIARYVRCPPWDWRQGKRQGAAQVQSQPQASSDTAPGQCAIKGNV